jgi:predicted nucleotidyltransferase
MNALRACGWEVTPAKVEEAVRRIIQLSRPLKVILFGSYTRGDTGVNSDLDILVVTQDSAVDSRKESVRIRRALRGIGMPMDIVVVPEDKWEQLKDRCGLIYREAASKGIVVYESPRSEKAPWVTR